MGLAKLSTLILTAATLAWPQPAPLKTTAAVLERYQQALGGVDAIKKVQSETRHGEAVDKKGKTTFIAYSKPFKWLGKITHPDGTQSSSGFDGTISWSIGSKGASIDKDTPLEAIRRDADLQYPLHQPDYFKKFELAGITDFEGRRCYWLHGTTHWGKDNNQYYDVETGLLAGYRFQQDASASAPVVTLLFQDYKNFGGPLVATKIITHPGDVTTFTSVSYDPLPDSLFDLPQAVKALLR